MCALAHFLEAEGIATVVISLIRLHSEKIRPPRTLFVPFELGRPLGDPGDVTGQRDVVSRALALLDHTGPEPVLEDYPDPVVRSDGPMIELPVDADLIREFGAIETAYDKFVAEHGGTTFGNSGMAPGDLIAAFSELLGGGNICGKRVPGKLIKFMIDDIKTLYFEAACHGHDALSSAQLGEWFWRKTAAGKAIADLRTEFIESDDKGRQQVVAFMVPSGWVDNLGLKI